MKCPVCEIHAESVFRIDGMDCHEEVAILERRLKPLGGLEHLTADIIGRRLRVQYDAAKLSASGIVDAVAQTGMRAWLEHEQPVNISTATPDRRWVLIVVSGSCLALAAIGDLLNAPAMVSMVSMTGKTGETGITSLSGSALALTAVITAGVYPLRRALVAIRSRVLDINVLMLFAVAGALVLGEWSEAGTVMVLFALAQLLEARAMDRARGAIRALMDLAPADALVRRHGIESRVAVDAVGVGERVIVKPGQKIPLDGIVAAGESDVNQAPVTGESLPADKGPGDEVFAGTINGRAVLDVDVTRLSGDTTLARIIHLVETAQAQRAPSQAFVERFARVYTPAVLVLALVVAVLPAVAFGQPLGIWIYRALVLLVISCPCALVISTPVAIVSALAGAARQGVLIKGGVHLERAAGIQCIAFDKTGTLTKGEPRVIEVSAVSDASRETVLAVAAALDAHSAHPIARAIVQKARQDGLPVSPGSSIVSLPGRGVAGNIGGRPALLGNHRLIEERGLCTPIVDAHLARLAAAGSTAVVVALDGGVIGVVGVADEVRETSRDTIALLREQGIAHVAMLSGDNAVTVRALAREIGVDDCRAELLPEDKVAAVGELRSRYGTVAMVGDGVNDAPALAAADVGIAMGVAGTDAALETADIALMADELAKIPYALRLSRATLRTIKVNIAFSILLKVAFLVLATAGIATLWMAVLADTGASLLVIANGLRLLRTR